MTEAEYSSSRSELLKKPGEGWQQPAKKPSHGEELEKVHQSIFI